MSSKKPSSMVSVLLPWPWVSSLVRETAVCNDKQACLQVPAWVPVLSFVSDGLWPASWNKSPTLLTHFWSWYLSQRQKLKQLSISLVRDRLGWTKCILTWLIDEPNIPKTWIMTKVALERNTYGSNQTWGNFINKKAVKSIRKALRLLAFTTITFVSISPVPSSVIDVE